MGMIKIMSSNGGLLIVDTYGCMVAIWLATSAWLPAELRVWWSAESGDQVVQVEASVMGRTAIPVPEGTRFGKWTVERELTANRAGQRRFLCRCTCGGESPVLLLNLRHGKQQGCRNCCRPGPPPGRRLSEAEKARRPTRLWNDR